MYPRVGEKRRIDDINLEDEEAIGSLCRLSGRPVSPKTAMEHEKRIRREIANSNERRRMQSINAGFASLKTLLPHHEGEKLSKATILQQTAEYIYQLEQEKTRLLSQNCQLKRLLNQQHHSDPEASPTGGDSPTDDRIPNSTSPPPAVVTTTSLSTPIPISAITTPGNKTATEPDDFRREVLETRIHLGERDRRTMLKVEDHMIRGLETEIYSEKQDLPQVKFNYSTVDLQPGMKIEIKNDAAPENHSKSESSSPLSTAALIAEVKNDAPTSTVTVESLEEYPDDMSEIPLPKAVFKTESTISSARVSLPPVGSPANLCSPNTGPTFKTSHVQQSPTSMLTQPTTIFTVVPSNKASSKTLSPLLELRDLSNVEGGEVTSPTATVEYVEDGSLRNHTVYIVNSSSSSCQKSLDTICEAIRHLEGDHMFPLEEQTVGASNIKEEVVTDETYTVEEDQAHHAVPQDIHHHKHLTSTIVTGSYDNVKESDCNGSSNNLSSPPIHSTHQLGGSMGHLTLHMIPPEPQEVPLELTTTHRASSEPPHPHQYVNHEVVCSTSQHVISHPTTFLHHTSRPGVIVVKHQ